MPKKKKLKKKRKPGFKKFIADTLGKIVAENNLGDYKVSFSIKEKNSDEDDDDKTVTANINVDDRYLTIHINIYPFIKNLHKENQLGRIREILCHETAHARVHTLERLGKERYVREDEVDHEVEKLAETIGKLMYRATF